MTAWRPSSGPDAARRRAELLRRFRAYFDATTMLEVATPALSTTAVSDLHIETLEVRSSLSNAPLYLHTSPEFCMKRLLAAGYPDIYSICRVFRDGENGRYHQPEFTLVEWYRLGFGLREMIADTVSALATALDDPALADEHDTVNFRDVFVDVVGADPIDASIAELAHAAGADADLTTTIGAERTDWLDLILTTTITPTFAAPQFTIPHHYPASLAALARRCPADAAVADRFEVFMGPVELANGYVELTDAAEQKKRMATDSDDRLRRGRPVRPEDGALLAALESGMPASAGVAVGLQRLQMITDKTGDIGHLPPLPFQARNA